MKTSLEVIKELREMTCASIAHCKKALEESKGDVKQAAVILRRLGLEIAAKKVSRDAKEGRIDVYVHHGNKIGVMLEVNCESDFVARNSDFIHFTKELAMHIAAVSPTYLNKEDVPVEILEHEKDKDRFYKTNCLLEQEFVKDPSITINDLLGSIVAKIGEKVVVRRFIRYKVGE